MIMRSNFAHDPTSTNVIMALAYRSGHDDRLGGENVLMADDHSLPLAYGEILEEFRWSAFLKLVRAQKLIKLIWFTILLAVAL